MISLKFKILLLSLCLGCAPSKVELAPHYKSEKPSFWEKVENIRKYGRKWGWAVGSSLTLNRDSTFDMTTCANFIHGKWHLKTDSLVLNYQQSCYKMDSFNHLPKWTAKLNVTGVTETYGIRGKYLERTAAWDSNRHYMLIKLIKSR